MPAGLTAEKFAELEQTIASMPPAAMQTLKYATFSPFSALGIARRAEERVLNTVNKKNLLKGYRKLALRLHPDKCDHPFALPAMQALNLAYDKATGKEEEAKKAAAAAAKKGAAARGRPGARR